MRSVSTRHEGGTVAASETARGQSSTGSPMGRQMLRGWVSGSQDSTIKGREDDKHQRPDPTLQQLLRLIGEALSHEVADCSESLVCFEAPTSASTPPPSVTRGREITHQREPPSPGREPHPSVSIRDGRLPVERPSSFSTTQVYVSAIHNPRKIPHVLILT